MGIRFRCHICNQPLNVKDFQAGKRGRCPGCQGAFRIPQADADFSIPLEVAKSESKQVTVPSQPPESVLRENEQTPVQTSVATLEQPSVEQPPSESSTGDMPKSLLQHLGARWFVRPPSGGQYGPSDTQTLVEWITQRRVTSDSYLWRDGMETWQLANELLPELFGSASTPATADVAAPPVSMPSPVTELAKEASKGSLATAKANLSQRRKKKQMRTWMIIGLLVAIVMGLIAILAVVLMR